MIKKLNVNSHKSGREGNAFLLFFPYLAKIILQK
jgi:hypothetical protein